MFGPRGFPRSHIPVSSLVTLAIIPSMRPVARASLSALVTILAIDGAITAWFKRHDRVLAAIGTRDGSSMRSVCLVLARCAVFNLL
jgi:hypothetical protein